ncbi:hypothetical protein ACUNHT_10050 [Serratia sp. IR-2025]
MNQIADALILVLNCGSSSIKFAVFDASLPVIPRKPLWNGKVQGIGEERPDFGETGTAPYRCWRRPKIDPPVRVMPLQI